MLLAPDGVQDGLVLNSVYMVIYRYGDLVFLTLGSKTLLLLSNYQLVQEILIKNADITSNRRIVPVIAQFEEYQKGKYFLLRNKHQCTNIHT